MHDEPHLYDVMFVSSDGQRPEFVFLVDKKHFEEIMERILSSIGQNEEWYTRRFEEKNTFSFGEKNLFDKLFGFNECGRIIEDGELIQFRIECCRGKVIASTLTLELLIEALSIPIEGFSDSVTHRQHVNIHTSFNPKRGVHACSAGGSISPDLFRKIRAHAKGGETVVPEVMETMQLVWRSIHGKRHQKYADDCFCCVYPDGRFILHCFGNACDMAIYSDLLPHHDELDRDIAFSCHNLDTPQQLLTLIAGFVKMCELFQT